MKEHLRWVELWSNYGASVRQLVTSWIWGTFKIGTSGSKILKRIGIKSHDSRWNLEAAVDLE